MRRRSLLCVLAISLPACGSETTAAEADEGTQASAEDAGDDTEDADESEGSAGEGADSTSTTGAVEFEPIPARGIRIATIEANQGVGVPIFADGAWVQGAGRNAELIKGRNMLVRAFWEIDPDFEPREIEARLELHLPDGAIETAAKVVLVDGESNPSVLNKSFWWGVPAELLEPGVEFQVTLWETDFGQEGTPEPSPAPSYPAAPEPVGLEQSDMTLRVLLVPVHHNLGAQCADPPVIDDIAIEIFRDHLYKQNPVQEVEITGREGIEWTDDLNSFVPLLGALANLHDTDGADPGVYYYGVVRPCDGGPSDVGGQAIDIPGYPSQGNYWSRTAVGRWYSDLGATAETFVHEIGHTQGRMHVYCNGEEGGPTPLYPYQGGIIGVWGFDVVGFDTLHKPDVAKDYMTYCGNTWVSDWGWRQVFPYIREITSWDAADTGGAPEQELLVGLVDPATGDEVWIATRGAATARVPAYSEALELVDESGLVHTLPATIGSMGEGGAYNVVVAVPQGIEAKRAQQITRLTAGTRRPVTLR